LAVVKDSYFSRLHMGRSQKKLAAVRVPDSVKVEKIFHERAKRVVVERVRGVGRNAADHLLEERPQDHSRCGGEIVIAARFAAGIGEHRRCPAGEIMGAPPEVLQRLYRAWFTALYQPLYHRGGVHSPRAG